MPATRWACLKRPGRECVTKVMQAWTVTTWRLPQTSSPQQRQEGALSCMIRKRSAALANEHMIVVGRMTTTAHQITLQACRRAVMKGYQAALPELGFKD